MRVRWMAVLSVGSLLFIGPAGDLAWAQAASLDYFSLGPCRVLDTRLLGQGPALASGVPRVVTVTSGTCGIPASARAISANITSVAPTGLGNLRLYPGDGAVPSTSSLNFGAGQTRSNNGVFALPGNGDGTLAILATVAASGTVHVVLDVTGYFVFPDERLRQAVTARLEAGMCVPEGAIGGSATGVDYCYQNDGGCNPGCRLTSQVQSLEVTPAGLRRATVDVVFDVTGRLPLAGRIVFISFSCSVNIFAPQRHLRSEVAYVLDSGTGKYTVTSETRSISPTFEDLQLSDCAAISDLGNLANDMLNAISSEFATSLNLVGLEF
jgi:hypothetical protein